MASHASDATDSVPDVEACTPATGPIGVVMNHRQHYLLASLMAARPRPQDPGCISFCRAQVPSLGSHSTVSSRRPGAPASPAAARAAPGRGQPPAASRWTRLGCSCGWSPGGAGPGLTACAPGSRRRTPGPAPSRRCRRWPCAPHGRAVCGSDGELCRAAAMGQGCKCGQTGCICLACKPGRCTATVHLTGADRAQASSVKSCASQCTTPLSHRWHFDSGSSPSSKLCPGNILACMPSPSSSFEAIWLLHRSGINARSRHPDITLVHCALAPCSLRCSGLTHPVRSGLTWTLGQRLPETCR